MLFNDSFRSPNKQKNQLIQINHNIYLIQYILRISMSDKNIDQQSIGITSKFLGMFKWKPIEKGKEENIQLKLNFTLILLGEYVGKTACFIKYTRNVQQLNCPSTLGAGFQKKIIQTLSSKIDLNIWDTNCSQKYQPILPIYIRKNNPSQVKLGAIFYKVSDRESFYKVKDLVVLWKKSHPQPLNSILIVANMIDLRINKQQTISIEQGLNLAKQLNVLYVQQSTKYDVKHIFQKQTLNLGYALLDLEFDEIQLERIKRIRTLEQKLIFPQLSSSLIINSWRKIITFLLSSSRQIIYRIKNYNYSNKGKQALQIIEIDNQRLQRIRNLQTIQFSLSFYQKFNKSSQTQEQEQLSNTHFYSKIDQKVQALELIKKEQQKKIQEITAKIVQQKQKFSSYPSQSLLRIKEDLKQCYDKYSRLQKFYQSVCGQYKRESLYEEQLCNTVTSSEEINRLDQLKVTVKNEKEEIYNFLKTFDLLVQKLEAFQQKSQLIVDQIANSIGLPHVKREDYESIDSLIESFMIKKLEQEKNFSMVSLYSQTKASKLELQQNIFGSTKKNVEEKINTISQKFQELIKYYENPDNFEDTHEQTKFKLEIEKHNLEMLRKRRGLQKETLNYIKNLTKSQKK